MFSILRKQKRIKKIQRAENTCTCRDSTCNNLLHICLGFFYTENQKLNKQKNKTNKTFSVWVHAVTKEARITKIQNPLTRII